MELLTVTLSDRVFKLLEDKLPNLGRRVEKAITKEIGAQVRGELNIEMAPIADAPSKPDSSVKIELASVPATVSAAASAAPETEVAPAAPAEAPLSKKSAGERIREIMHRTRQRFEGEDYKTNATGENVRKYHQALRDLFIQIAVQLGYEKPSLIDTPEKIAAFAAECDALALNEKGVIATPEAPF